MTVATDVIPRCGWVYKKKNRAKMEPRDTFIVTQLRLNDYGCVILMKCNPTGTLVPLTFAELEAEYERPEFP